MKNKIASLAVWITLVGFVAGKIQTQYPWSSWKRQFTAEPDLWHHDVLRPDGTPHRQSEVVLIKTLVSAKP